MILACSEFGYVDKEQSNMRFHFVKDHLGSIRQVIDQDGNISSARDYYPYGSILREYNNGQEERFMFTEKERDKETNFDYFSQRDGFARCKVWSLPRSGDSDIGRWTTIDPLADKYPGWSPYAYTLDNPLNYFDPDGKYVVSSDGRNVYRVTLAQNTIQSTLSYVAPVSAAAIKYATGDPSWGFTASDLAGPIVSGIMGSSRLAISLLGGTSKTANLALGSSEMFGNYMLSLGIDIQTSEQIENNLLMDREIFNIAEKRGLGKIRTSRSNQFVINRKLDLTKTKIEEKFDEIKKDINDFLNGRKLNELNGDELEELRDSL